MHYKLAKLPPSHLSTNTFLAILHSNPFFCTLLYNELLAYLKSFRMGSFSCHIRIYYDILYKFFSHVVATRFRKYVCVCKVNGNTWRRIHIRFLRKNMKNVLEVLLGTEVCQIFADLSHLFWNTVFRLSECIWMHVNVAVKCDTNKR